MTEDSMQRTTLALALYCITQLANAQNITLEQSAQTNLTLDIYRHNQALIQDSRILGPINRNDSVTISDISEKILPQSLHIFNAGEITEQTVDNPLTYRQLINQNIGKKITLIQINSSGSESTRTVTLISTDTHTAIIDNQGRIETIPLHSNQWRLAFHNSTAKELTSTAIHFRSKGKKYTGNILLNYSSSDVFWDMNYILALNVKTNKLVLNGLAAISNNTATHFTNAKISLRSKQPKNTTPYQIPQRTSLLPQQQTLIPIAQASNIDATVQLRFTTYITRQPNKKLAPQHPNRYLSFLNSAKYQLGETLPAGKAQVFITKDSHTLQLMGEGDLARSEAGGKTQLPLGKATDFTITQRATGRQDTFDGSITSSQFILKNSSNQSQTLIISVRFKHPSQIISSTYPPSNKQPLSARWAIPVRGNSTHVFDLITRLKHPKY